MVLWTGWVLWALGTAAAVTPAAPSVAVLRVEAQKGVDAQTARVLTDHLVAELRRGGAFSRVVSGTELESILDLEKQRQLFECDRESCLGEIAGALGVDHLMVASVARLGTTFIVQLRVLDARNGSALATFSETLPGVEEDALLLSFSRGALSLADQLRTHRRAAGRAPRAVPTPPAQAGPPAAPGEESTETPRRFPVARLAAWGAGGALGGTALLLLAAGVAGGALGWALKGFINLVASPLSRYLVQVQLTYVSAWVGGAAAITLALLFLAAGAAALGTGLLL